MNTAISMKPGQPASRALTAQAKMYTASRSKITKNIATR